MALHGVVSASVAKDNDVAGSKFFFRGFGKSLHSHGSGVVEVSGHQAFESRFSGGAEVVGDEGAAVISSPFVSAPEFLILVDGVGEFRMEGECGFRGG